MSSLAITLSLFVFWFVVGRGFRVLGCARQNLEELLLAPVFGLALTVLPLFLASFAGVSVAVSAKPVFIGLLVVASLLLLVVRPALPRPIALAFLALALVSLLFTGWPALQYGSGWLSLCNGDMTNYCLRAQRLKDHPLREIPPLSVLLSGQDYCQYYWFMDVASNERVGVDLLLAWTMDVFGLPPHTVFMPLILAFHLVQMWAAAAFVLRASGRLLSAFVLCVGLTFSALYNLGTIYQLLAQVAGLGLLCGAATLLLRPYRDQTTGESIEHGLWCAVLLTAHLVIYPEAFPFLVLGLGVYLTFSLLRGELAARPFFLAAGVATLGTLTLLGSYSPWVMRFIARQVTNHGSPNVDRMVFPYYLLPSGALNLWGLASIDRIPPPGLALSVQILFCGYLLLSILVLSIRGIRAGRGPHTFVVVMAVVAVGLFRQNNGFGLFKLAMFVQPFLWGVVAMDWASPRHPFGCALFLLLLSWNVPRAKWYVDCSTGTTGNMSETRDATRGQLLKEFTAALARHQPRAVFIDSFNQSLVRLLLPYLQGIPTANPNIAFGTSRGSTGIPLLEEGGLFAPEPEVLTFLARANVAFRTSWRDISLDLHPGTSATFPYNTVGRSALAGPGAFLVNASGWSDILNRRKRARGEQRRFLFSPLNSVWNHLVYIPQRFSRMVDEGNYLFHLESDVMVPGGTFSALGGTTIYEVINPAPDSRLLVDFTATINADREALLPPAAVIGSARVNLGWNGRGAARVYSPPITAQRVEGRDYLALELSGKSNQFRSSRSGLSALFGGNLELDYRKFHGFTRDISLVTEAEYQRIVPPAAIRSFPQDLMDPALEFYGIMEDGWIGECAACRLSQTKARSRLVLRGRVQDLGDRAFKTRITLRVDQKEVAAREVGCGTFTLLAEIPPADAPHWIRIDSSKIQHLPVGDARSVGVRLESIGFEPPSDDHQAWRKHGSVAK